MRHALTVLKLRILRSWWLMLLVAVIGSVIAVGLQRLDLFGINDAENGAMDSGMGFWLGKMAVPPAEHTAIVGIDQGSFNAIAANPSYTRSFGSWPFQRTLWARVMTELTQLGARAIVFDLTLSEAQSDPTNDENLRAAIADQHLPVYLTFSVGPNGLKLPRVQAVNVLPPPTSPSHGRPSGGLKLVPPVKRTPRGKKRAAPAEVAPAAPPSPEPAGGSFEDSFPDTPAAPAVSPEVAAAQHAEHVAHALAFPAQGEGLALPVFAQDSNGKDSYPIPPIDTLLDAAPGFGLSAQESDGDGRMRLTRFAYTDTAGNAYATLAVAVMADLLRVSSVTVKPGELQMGDHHWRINGDGSGRVHYRGTLQQRYPKVIPLVSVLDNSVLRAQNKPLVIAPDAVKGRVVLIGGFATGTSDVKATPLESSVPGVVKHATDLESLLGDGFIIDSPYWSSLLLTFLVAFFSAAIIMVVRSPFLEIGFPIALFFLFYLAPGWLLVHHQIHILSAVPSMAGSIASVAATVSNHLFAEHDRELYRETFGRYMERTLVDQLVEGKHLPPLDGVTQPVTAFFSDIRGFSTFSEKFASDPKTLMKILNEYLTSVTNVLVNEERATLDKYVGDSVIALFNAPLPQEDHALRACRAALSVQRAVVALCASFKERGWPDVTTRIGVNTGLMTVGNLGSEQLVDYTAIGDEMNLASRLEGANKAYDTRIMIGQGTYQLVKEDVVARELDMVRVPGKEHAVTVYELVGLRGEVSAEREQLHAIYARALAHFRAAEFEVAISVCNEALAHGAADGPSLALKARCEEFLAHPPPAPFDGVNQLHK